MMSVILLDMVRTSVGAAAAGAAARNDRAISENAAIDADRNERRMRIEPSEWRDFEFGEWIMEPLPLSAKNPGGCSRRGSRAGARIAKRSSGLDLHDVRGLFPL